jgi:hypothetical protein
VPVVAKVVADNNGPGLPCSLPLLLLLTYLLTYLPLPMFRCPGSPGFP